MDIVITYVNGLDPEWQKDYEKHTNTPILEKRFRDWGTLKYLMRGIEKNMPFIRKVHLVVSQESQLPEWIDPANVNGKDANYTLITDNCTLSGNATLDQGNVYLKSADDAVEFTVKASEIEFRGMGYTNAAALDIYVNGTLVEDNLGGLKNADYWRSIAEGLSSNKETTVRIVNAGGVPVVIDGIYLTVNTVDPGDINEDGVINALDLTLLRKYLLDIFEDGIDYTLADLNGDNTINILDLIRLKKQI